MSQSREQRNSACPTQISCLRWQLILRLRALRRGPHPLQSTVCRPQRKRLTYEGTFSYLSLKGEDLGAIEKKLVLLESIPAPVEPGQKAGVLEYSLGGKKLGEVNVLTNGSIREAGYMDYLKKLVGAWRLNRR